ncbi:oligosaccharide flippase family protein [Maribacter sp. 2307ULW6-5]|uniref:oligosaccharide flippase family protein n=1 Tax=Maribacter sp. 2307ULW6-5 TaxID=3386275 RepID=UPI0039BD77C7
MFSKSWSKFSKSEFSRNVSSQILGTGTAQALPFLATPLLTRLFTEADFAVYTSFFAVASIFAVGVGGKYQLAIVLPHKEEDAQNLFVLSIYVTFGYAFLIALLLPMFHGFFPKDLQNALYFVAPHVLFFGVWSAYINQSIRQKRFATNAYAKVIQSIGYIVAAIGLGAIKFLSFGLVIAKILGTVASYFFLHKKSIARLKIVPLVKLKKVAKTYVDYPKYGIGPAFLNTVSLQALVLILTKYYTTDDLGHYGLTLMVLSAPLTLIGNSYKDVFYQKMASLVMHRQYHLAMGFFKKSTLALLSLSAPICLILFFFGESLFHFIFGENWIRSGEFATILAFSFGVRLVVSPLSSIFNATNTLRIASVWQILYFISTFATLIVCAAVLKLPVTSLLVVYVVHEIILYTLYLSIQYYVIRFKITNGKNH